MVVPDHTPRNLSPGRWVLVCLQIPKGLQEAIASAVKRAD
ncbi:hypothetical protein SPLC1_S171130 [Arthrospira platensis C1]|nr:hypothetical protein SPLC1_S171130 [Arthrospira platensis C1]